MENLSQRQIEILKVIIKEHSETGQPVGSEILEKKYKLGVSPATIRNEMVELAKRGYLKKTYFSSGRVPSAKGFRFYIQKIMKEKELTTSDEVSYKNSIWDERNQVHRLLSQATKILSQKTGLLSIATTNTGDLFYSGAANLFKSQEFFDLDLSRNLFERLEELPFWARVLDKFGRLDGEILFMLGEEDFSDPAFEECASVFGEFEGKKTQGMIGVVGPKCMHYDFVVPQIKYFSTLISEIIKSAEA